MPFCPNCRAEYRQGFSVCADCGDQLTETLPELPEEEKAEEKKVNVEYGEPVFISSTVYGVEQNMMVTALREEGIPVCIKHQGSGHFLSVYMGASSLGTHLFVPACMVEKALLVIAGLSDTVRDEEKPDIISVADDDGFQMELQQSALKRRIRGWIILAFYFDLPSLLILFIVWLLFR